MIFDSDQFTNDACASKYTLSGNGWQVFQMGKVIGFHILSGNTEVDGVAATVNYDSQVESRVRFQQDL